MLLGKVSVITHVTTTGTKVNGVTCNMNEDDPDIGSSSQYCCHGDCKPYIKYGHELWEGLLWLVELDFYWKCRAGGKAFAKWVDCDPVKNTLKSA